MLTRTIVAAALAICAALPVRAGEIISGPILAEVISVYDGDSITVDAHPWPQITIRVSVRVYGIDAPEIRGKCEAEKKLAREARDFVREAAEDRVVLWNVTLGKYAGRVIADVFTTGGLEIANLLIDAGLARSYEGGARGSWCD